MENLMTWFEIPVTDMHRAVRFYTEVFGWKLDIVEADPLQFAFFDFPEHRTGGSLSCGEFYQPGTDGAIVYLYAGKDLSEPLSRVEPAGGKVVMPKQPVGEHGYTAWFLDTEGNRIGLHSEF